MRVEKVEALVSSMDTDSFEVVVRRWGAEIIKRWPICQYSTAVSPGRW